MCETGDRGTEQRMQWSGAIHREILFWADRSGDEAQRAEMIRSLLEGIEGGRTRCVVRSAREGPSGAGGAIVGRRRTWLAESEAGTSEAGATGVEERSVGAPTEINRETTRTRRRSTQHSHREVTHDGKDL